MSPAVALSLSLVLLAGNAFFVGAEFALIAARRSQIEPRARAGSRLARTTLAAMEQITLVMAGAQLGITVCSLGLGAVSEPAIAHGLEPWFERWGLPEGLVHPVALAIALAIVVYLHVVLGEMVPKNIALAGPEKAAMLLVPPYLLWVKATRPIIAVYDWCARTVVRALGVEPKTELENTVSMVELAEMIAESRSEGLLDPEEHLRLARALQIRNRVAGDVAVPLEAIHTVPVAAPGKGPRVADVEQALANTGYSRFPVVDSAGRFIGFVHIKDMLDLVDDPAAVVGAATVRYLPRLTSTMPLPEALSRLRQNNSHLALLTAADGTVCGMVTMEDLVEDLVGTVRDGMHRG